MLNLPTQSQAPSSPRVATPPPARPLTAERVEDEGYASPNEKFILPLPFPTYDTRQHVPSTSAIPPTTAPALSLPTPMGTPAAVATVPAATQMPMMLEATTTTPAMAAAPQMQPSGRGIMTSTTAEASAQTFHAQVEPEPDDQSVC